MASGSILFEASGYLQGKIEWSSKANGSISNNSTVTANLYARRTNSATTHGKSWGGYVKVGTKQTNINFSNVVYVSSSWVHMATVTTTVAHSDDGTGSVGISGSVTGPSGTSLSDNTSKGSEIVTLDEIPRGTDVPAFSAGYVEDSYVLTLSPKITGAQHSVKITIGDFMSPSDIKWLQEDGSLGDTETILSGTSLPMTLPASYYNVFSGPNTTGLMYLFTYVDGEKIDFNTKSFKLGCSPTRCTPIIDATAKDVNEKTVSLTGDENTIVANASIVEIVPTIQISDEDDTTAIITSKSVDGTVFTTAVANVVEPEKNYFELSVTNSRGLSANKTIIASGRLVPYIKPSFDISNLKRPEPTSDEVIIKYTGRFYPGEFTDNMGDDGIFNELTIKWSYRSEDDEDYIEGGYLTPIINAEDNTYSGLENLGELFDYRKRYIFKFEYTDKIMGGTITDFVMRGIPVYWWTEDSFNIEGDLYIKGVPVSDLGGGSSETTVLTIYDNPSGLTIKKEPGETLTVNNMPKLTDYIGKRVKFYVGYNYDYAVGYELVPIEGKEAIFFDYVRDYNGNDMWRTLFRILDFDTTTWNIKTCVSVVTTSAGVTSKVNNISGIRLYKIEVMDADTPEGASSFHDTLPIGTVIDYDGDTVPDGYEKVSDGYEQPVEQDTYSLNEQVIGTWVNGEPLYRRVVTYTGGLTGNENTLIGNIGGNIADVISVSCINTNTSNTNAYFLYTSSSSKFGYVSVQVAKASGDVWATAWNESWGNPHLIVIIKYTKTTD